MRMFLRMMAAVVFVFSSLCSFGQDTLRLSLDSAVSYALLNNKVLINARFANQKADQKVKETTAAGFPQVEAGVTYNNFLGAEAQLHLSEAAPPATIKFNPTSNFSFTASQLIFNGGYFVGIQLSKLARQASELNYQRTELDIKQQVKSAYFLVLVSLRNLDILEANRESMNQLYDKSQRLVAAGIQERTEADKISVRAALVDNSLKATERQIELGFNMLRLYTGLEADVKLKLITSLEDVVLQKNFEAYQTGEFNLSNNYDYKLIQNQEELAEKQVSLEKAAYLPTLSGYYSYTEKLLKPKFDMTPKNVVGLNLSIPIFSSGVRSSRVKQSRINLMMVQNSRDLLAQQMGLQEKQLRYNLNNLIELYKSQQKNAEVAKEVFSKMSLKFDQGIISSLDLIIANSEYLSAESSFTNTLFQLLDAEMALKKLNGSL